MVVSVANTSGESPTRVAGAAATPLDRFRAIVFADPALQLELAQPHDPAVFAALAARRARERGVALRAEAIAAVARPEGPPGPSRRDAAFERSVDWPAGDWIPVEVEGGARPYVEWAQFAGAPLRESFFEESRHQAASRPFNAVFRRRTGLADFIAAAARPDRARVPRGLIFHMSRCGSTLVARMLAAAARNAVISEARILDAAVQLEAGNAGLLAAAAAALGRRQPAADSRLFLKLDSWHAMSLPLIRRSFPSTPWVFLYRDPLEVMVSQARRAGIQTVPGLLPREVVGMDAAGMAPDAYGAAVLARICAAAADEFARGGGLLVNYGELPGAVFSRILPHFGFAADADEVEAMTRASRHDAKAPLTPFAPDGEAKRARATPRLLGLVARHMAAPYRRLEALRLGRAAP